MKREGAHERTEKTERIRRGNRVDLIRRRRRERAGAHEREPSGAASRRSMVYGAGFIVVNSAG